MAQTTVKMRQIAGGLDGWIPAEQTWTYASATTITVPSGAASKYQKGDKIKLTQTTVKYFYVVGVADTVLTVTGGSDYTVANAAITLPFFSKIENPQGFPGYFSYVPTWGVTSGTAPAIQNGTLSGRLQIKGDLCFFTIYTSFGSSTTYGQASTIYYWTRPLTGVREESCSSVADDAGTAPYAFLGRQVGSSNRIYLFTTTSTNGYVTDRAPVTWASGDFISITGSFYY